MQFTERYRWGLNYMFKHMTAYSYMWDITWEYALEECNDDIGKAVEFLDEFCTKREAISITSAMRKAGYDHKVVSKYG